MEYNTHLHTAWHTGKLCKCGTCYCCDVYRSQPIAPKSDADALVDDLRASEWRSAAAWSSYMSHRLNNRT